VINRVFRAREISRARWDGRRGSGELFGRKAVERRLTLHDGAGWVKFVGDFHARGAQREQSAFPDAGFELLGDVAARAARVPAFHRWWGESTL